MLKRFTRIKQETQTARETLAGANVDSYYDAIKRDYEHVKALRAGLRAFLENGEVLENHRQRFAELVVMFRDQLAFHFALQEAAGYFKDTRDNVPCLSEVAKRLRNQHIQLFQTICEIAEDIDELLSDTVTQEYVDKIVDRIRAFDFELQQHEESKVKLLCEGINRDIGGEG